MSEQLNNRYYEKGDTIRVKTLGLSANDAVSNNWLVNSATVYGVESLEKINLQNFRYKVILNNNHIFKVGDSLKITGNDFEAVSKIYSVNGSNQITIGDQGNLDSIEVSSLIIKRNILKASATNFDVSQIAANIQNVYKKQNNTLVASSSIPSYGNLDLSIKNTKITFSGTFPPTGSAATDTFKIISSGDHGFYTGDSIYYSPQKITTTSTDIDGNTITTTETQVGIAEEGIYFIQRLANTTQIKLAQSKSQLFDGDYITTEPISITDNTIELYRYKDKTLSSQKLFREIPTQNNESNSVITEPGTRNGILVDGVEILNYKSLNGLNYGKIKSITVDNPGSGYDVINPPNLVITDIVGTGATANAIIEGSFNKINVAYGGFDYITDPIVQISGGNGKGAEARANTSLIKNSVNFNSAEIYGLVTIGSSSAIGFSTNHRFRDHERVIYKTNGEGGIVGLTTGAFYYVNIQSPTSVKLFKTQNDSIAGLNTITFTDYGSGRHALEATDLKKVVSSVEIVTPGSGYQNRKTTAVGVSTSLNEININNHGYSSGEKIKYTPESTVLGGLISNTEYYVTSIDKNNIRLSDIGPSSDLELYYRTKQYVDITSPQSQIDGFLPANQGIHHFNYPEISVSLIGEIGISSVGSETFEARVTPIVRGSIVDVNLSNEGVGYGSSEVLNYIREPQITTQVGSDVQLSAIVSDGKIVEIIVQNGGKNIHAVPKITVVSDTGQGCVLSSNISGGRITSVEVISGGIDYIQGNTSIVVIYPGVGVSFRSRIQRWTVNEYQKNIINVGDDDNFIETGINEAYGLQCLHLYAPRLLRSALYQSNQDGSILYNSSDLTLDNGSEKITSKNHSPIIGWAYDGHPIYGPFGYLNKNGGIVTQIKSGYKLRLQTNRPPTTQFPEGFFVEDYQFIESGSDDILDENNGRFCITPEFPKGTYAYFSTFSEVVDSQGKFKNYKSPVFPYLIGNSLYSKPSKLSYLKTSNHDQYDIQEYGWIRNTSFYNLEEEVSSYDYVERPFKLKNNQISKVSFASPGYLDNIGILTGGSNYKVGDALIIDNEGTSGYNASVKVSKVGGKVISSINCVTSIINSIEVLPAGKVGEYSFTANSPHNLLNKEIVSIAGLSTTSVNLTGQYNVGISTATLVLRAGVGTTAATGIVTYFSVYGIGLDDISENDIFNIEDEKIKILNTDKVSSRIRVQREVLGSTGTAHTTSTVFHEDPRTFIAKVGFKTTFNFRRNRELYFNPVDTVAIGTQSGVGIGTTITFTNPGSGATSIFVPTQTLYFPGHNLETDDELIYNLNGGSAIGVSTNGISTSVTLSDLSKVYVAKINNNEIGISTVRIGINSTGSFAGTGNTTMSQGLLFFTDQGSGDNHSFKTNYTNVITVSSSKNTVTVSTAQTHGLSVEDNVYVDVRPSITTSFAVSYNDHNQRIIIDRKDVSASGINTTTNEITIERHDYTLGQSVIYTASSVSGGLVDEKIYYVVIVDQDTIRLSETYHNAIGAAPTIVNITSATDSSFSPINPPIKVYKNSKVEFDLSDSSLSYVRNSISYPAFKFALFTDTNFDTVFDKTVDNEDFEVITTGTIGVDGKLTLTFDENLPKTLYYKLLPIQNDILPIQKLTAICDADVIGYNQLQIINSVYSGKQSVSIASSTAFRYFTARIPEQASYTESDASLNYETDSPTGIGSISELKTFNKGENYYKLPSIKGVRSGIGSNASFELQSDTIGSIKKTKLRDIGFDYAYDRTLRPAAKLPDIFKINNLAILNSVGITSFGYGYGSIPPKVIVFDGETGDELKEVDLKFEFGESQLQIVSNTYGMNKVTPRFLPTINSNGVGISTLAYNSSTKDVTVTLSTGFTTAGSFPFTVGDEIMIENTSVGIASTNPQGQIVVANSGKGYNTENYNYKLFVVSGVDENIGGIGIVTFSLDGYLAAGENPGTFSITRSAGRIIPSHHFPIFESTLTVTNFVEEEKLISLEDPKATGVVERWDNQNGYLKVRSDRDFTKGHVVEGQSSKTRGTIASILSSDSSYDINATSKVESGWENIFGFLNDTRQVIQDGDYYQKFSYSLKSKIELNEWDDLVGSINHTAGFKRFSDLIIETSPEVGPVVGLGTDLSYFDKIIEFVGHVDLNCVYNFDKVKENYKAGFSDDIIFSNKILTDYEESVGNRVLNVDNVAATFNSNPRATRFSNIASWPISDAKAHKFLTYIQDPDHTAEAQVMFVTLLHDAVGNGYLNQYARVETELDLGSFDYIADGTNGVLQFYPTKFKVNPYNVFTLSYNIGDTVTSVGSSYFGGAVSVETTSVNVSVGTTTNIVSIASTFESAKVLVEVKTVDGEFEFNELTLLHNGTDVDLIDYGQLTTIGEFGASSSGFGTYHPYIDGSNIKVDFIPNVSVASSVNTIIVAISSEGVGVGSFGFSHAEIGALPTSIGSSGSPTENAIAEYTNETYNGGYFIVQVSDPDNNHHQVSELMLIDQGPDFTTTFLTEFGNLTSTGAPLSGLGTFGANVSGDIVRLTFTPNAGINAEVRTFYNYMKYVDNDDPVVELDFTNAYLDTQYGDYSGTDTDIMRAFAIKYGGYDVFERYIDSTDETIIGSDTLLEVPNAITMPNHFFVSGEKLTYSNPGAGTTQSISIGSTNVSGVGVTDKLPSTVYAIKVDSNKIRLTDTPNKALKAVPNEYFEISSVGIGTSHTFTANNQNSKCLIAIDNYIQSPVVATALTTSLDNQLFASQDSLFTAGISSIFGGDLIQIEDEIMKVQSVGVGSTNIIRVNRAWLGTRRAGYSTGTTVTKVQGNYNIVNNTLNFVEAPYGNIPLSSTTNPPDSRDWTGITTSSTFQARVFLRSGTPGSSVDSYAKNYIFNDVSSQFNGTENTFTLKSNGSDTDGYENDNAIILVNDIFQIPGLARDYTLSETSGITSAIFGDDGQTITYDVNSSNLPVGGVIVSVGSSSGFGYQPLVSAGGTATVSIAGTISAVTIGSTGSGYRASENYQVLTSIATTVAIGSTIMTLVNENSIFKYLDFLSAGSTCTIGVGTYIKSTNIISVGTTAVNIGIGSTSPFEIAAGTTVAVNIPSPTLGIVNVGVANSAVGIQTVTHIGVATISAGHLLETVHITSVGSGYTTSNLPDVIIDDPLSYTNIPLIYQTDGLVEPSTGLGTQSKINLNVGFGSDMIDFEISNTGFGYGNNQSLTVPTGGVAGIPTDATVGGDFERFTILIEKTYTDKFAGWSVGQLQPVDKFDDQFDGQKTDFQIKIGGTLTSIIASKGSSIVIQDVLVVFVNNILQIPGDGYVFNGGSTIIFPEAPKFGDKIDIIFYRGNGSVDVESIDVLETVKKGDTLKINYDASLGQSKFLEEDSRLVYEIESTDVVSTNAYYGPGNVDDINLERPVTWCRQTADVVIDGQRVAKDRDQYKANIYPVTNVIQTVGVGSTTIYVESVLPLFNQQNESSISLAFQEDILLVSQDARVAAAATAVVSAAGTITSIAISDGGVGYTTSPVVTIGNPVGLGTTQRQSLSASIASGSVASISLTGSTAVGYASTNPPVVLIEPPSSLSERIKSGVNYSGDFGLIVGVGTTSIVGTTTALEFEFYIPDNSALRDTTLVGTAITISGISTNDYFVLRNANVGSASTSIDENGATVGVGTTALDNVYKVLKAETVQELVSGVGNVFLRKVTVGVVSYEGFAFVTKSFDDTILSFDSTTTTFDNFLFRNYYGLYSWGKIDCTARTSTSEFPFYNQNGVTGISTSAYVRRQIPLKNKDYNV